MINYKNQLKNKILLITGGTGSFGNAFLKSIKNSGIKEVRVFSRDEKKQDQMRKLYNDKKIKFFIGDVRDPKSIDEAMENVNLVFHAAALKQVPSCEFFPLEAIKTNVIGTENVLNSAIDRKISKCVILSTDKAVLPINSMGMSKGIMEKVVIAKARMNPKTKLIITRYGNVIGSRGSVIPLFLDQISNNKPITITNENMTRFMMTMDDAINLVFFAFMKGNNGDIFIKKSPSALIKDVLKSLTILLGKTKIKKQIIGIRHAEKMHEVLMSSEEANKCKDLGDFFKIPLDSRDLNYSLYFDEGKKEKKMITDYSSVNTKILTPHELVKLFKKVNILSTFKNELE